MNCCISSQKSLANGLKCCCHIDTILSALFSVFFCLLTTKNVLRGILNHVQVLDDPLPTFVTHMLSEFNKLKSPPAEQEQIELICYDLRRRHATSVVGDLVRVKSQLCWPSLAGRVGSLLGFIKRYSCLLVVRSFFLLSGPSGLLFGM